MSFHTPSIFAVSIYSLFYLLYILYPNILRRELQPDGIQPVSNAEKQTQRLGIEKVLLVSFIDVQVEFLNNKNLFSASLLSFQTTSEYCLWLHWQWKTGKSLVQWIVATNNRYWWTCKEHNLSPVSSEISSWCTLWTSSTSSRMRCLRCSPVIFVKLTMMIWKLPLIQHG